MTILKYPFFIPQSVALISIFGPKQQLEGDHKTRTDPTGPSEPGYSGYRIAHAMSEMPKIAEI